MFSPSTTKGEELFVTNSPGQEQRVEIDDVLYPLDNGLSVSPDGKYGIVEVAARQVPAFWLQYHTAWLQDALKTKRNPGEVVTAVEKRVLVNLRDRTVTPLFNTPVSPRYDRVVWSADSRSLILSGVYLPLDEPLDQVESRERTDTVFVVRIVIPESRWSIVWAGEVWVKSLSDDGRAISLGRFGKGIDREEMTVEEKDGTWFGSSKWQSESRVHPAFEVTLEEDANTPPRIVGRDQTGDRSILLLDLNPGFAKLRFGKVEVMRWKAKDGHEVMGGLFFLLVFVLGCFFFFVFLSF